MARSYSGVVPFLISLVGYIILGPPSLLILLINEIVRLIVSLYLYVKHGGEVWLVPDGNDGVYATATHNPDRSPIVLFLLRFKGNMDRESLENMYREKIRPDLDSGGNLAYRKLEYLLIREGGYPCWKRDGQFNITNHVKMLDDHKQYDKVDLKKLLKDLGEDDMDPSRPQWELIILPRYKDPYPGDKGETGYLIFRFSHCYMDGLSFTMLLKRLLTTNFNYYLDPLTFKIPSRKRYLFYMNAFIYGPYTVLTTLMNKYNVYWPLCQPSSKGEKVERNLAWTEEMSMDSLHKISRAASSRFKVTISSILQTAFISAAIQLLPKERIPDEWVIGEIAALLPYPGHHLQNRFGCYIYSVNSFVNGDDFVMLRGLGRAVLEGATGPFLPLSYYPQGYINGRLPCFLHPFLVLDGAFSTTFLSNVPMSKSKAWLFNGAEILEIFGFAPQLNDTGITLMSCSYCDSLKVAAVAKSSWLLQEELESILGRIPAIIEKWTVIADKITLVENS